MSMTPRTEPSGASYVEWSAVIAGAVLAMAISVVLLQFGSAIGLAVTEPLRGEGLDPAWRTIAIGIWLLWVQLLASLSGGYLAGRMRAPVLDSTPHEMEFRDGVHGLLVWAVAMVVVAAGTALAAALAALAPETAGQAARTQAMLDLEANKSTIFAFAAAAISIVSAVAAWWAATVGGDHRDKAVDFSRYLTFRR